MRIEKGKKNGKTSVKKEDRFVYCGNYLSFAVYWRICMWYGQIDSRLNKIETPQLDESKIAMNDSTTDVWLYNLCTFSELTSVPRMLRA